MSQDEILLLKKVYKNACYVKYSIIALAISFLSMFGLVVANFIGFQSNSSDPFHISDKCFLAFGILDVLLLVIYCIGFFKFYKIIKKDPRWDSLLDKFSPSNKETLNNQDSDFQNGISGYLLGDLLTQCDELKEMGSLVKTASAGYLVYLLIRMCNKVIQFSKMLSKKFNFELLFHSKLFLGFIILMCLIINFVDFRVIINQSKVNNKKYDDIAESIHKICSNSDCTLGGLSSSHNIEIELMNSEVEVALNENLKVKSLNYYIKEINKNLSDEEKVQFINDELEKLHGILQECNELKFESMELMNHYQLTDNFINQMGNIVNEDHIRDEYERNNYRIEISGGYDSDDDEIYVFFKIQK